MEPPEQPKEDIVYADFLTDEQFFPDIVYDPLFQEPINLVPQPTSAIKNTVVYPPRTEIPEMVEFLAMTEEPLKKIILDFDEFDAQLEGVIRMEDQIEAEAIIAELNLDQTYFEPPMGQPLEPQIEQLFEISTDRLFEPLTRPLLKSKPELFEPAIMPLPKEQSEPPIEPPVEPATEPATEPPIEPPIVSVVVPHWPETTVMTLDELKRSPEYNVFDFSLR